MALSHSRKICAAGLPSKNEEHVGALLKEQSLQDTVDALIGDAIFPVPKEQPYKKHPPIFNEMAEILNPRPKTNFERVAEDLKETVYRSYWRSVGKSPTIPMFPDGYDIEGTRFGIKTVKDKHSAYEQIFPKDFVDRTPKEREAGVQLDRKFCRPAFSKDYTYGIRVNADESGSLTKCCLQYNDVLTGASGYIATPNVYADFQDRTLCRPGRRLAASNDILKQLPPGHAFGKHTLPSNIAECLSYSKINPDVVLIRKCLAHINSVKRNISKWQKDIQFFNELFRKLKYRDIEHSNKFTKWLPKKIVYDVCLSARIVLDPTLIEPLLQLWDAFDGTNIKYPLLLKLVNNRETLPNLPKLSNIEPRCLDFRTTYNDMAKDYCDEDATKAHPAGVPSKRIDLDFPVAPASSCKAFTICLGDESDAKSCINPSIMTYFNITHRDLYGVRSPEQIRMIFENAGETFTDETFNKLLEKAKSYHSDGWVCIRTFHKAMAEMKKKEDK